MKPKNVNSYLVNHNRTNKRSETEKINRKTPIKGKEVPSTNHHNTKKEDAIFNSIKSPKNKSFITHNNQKKIPPLSQSQRVTLSKTPTRPRSPKNMTIKNNTISLKNSSKEVPTIDSSSNNNTLNKATVEKSDKLPRPFSLSLFKGIQEIKEINEEENKNENQNDKRQHAICLTDNNLALPGGLQWSSQKTLNIPRTLISCPKCHKIPLISLGEKEMDKIKIHCSCSYKGSIPLKEFINENKRPKQENKKCLKHSKKFKDFCINCQKWLCEDCVGEHQKFTTHILIKNQISIELICKEHRNKPFEFFCLKCHLNLCKDCLHLHSEHKTVQLSEFLSNEKYSEIESNYSKALQHIDVYMRNLKDKLVYELQAKIAQIEDAYSTNNEINHSLLDLFSIIMNNFNIFRNSYFTASNVINNCNFNLEKIVPKHFEDKVTRLITYFNNSFIAKSNGKIDVFDEYYTANLSLQKKLTDNTDSISSIILLHDGRLATSSSDKTIRVINLKSYKTELIIEGHTGPIKYLSQMKNNKLLSCSDDHTIKIWSLKGFNSFTCEATLNGHESGIYQVIPISKNRIASCSEDNTIKIWNGEHPYNCIQTLQGHKYGVIAILQTKEEDLFSASSDLKIWDMDNYTIKLTLSEIQCSYRNSMIEITESRVVIGERYGIIILNSKNYEVIKKISDTSIGWVNAIIFIRPQILVCGCDFGLIAQINSATYKIMCKNEKAHEKNIRALLKVKDNFLASADGKGVINFWNMNIEKCMSSS